MTLQADQILDGVMFDRDGNRLNIEPPIRVGLPEIPDLSEHIPIAREDVRLGMRILAHRIIVDTRSGAVLSVPNGLVIEGRVISVPTAGDPRQFVVVGERPDTQAEAIVPLKAYVDGLLVESGELKFDDEDAALVADGFAPRQVTLMQIYRHGSDTETERTAWVAAEVTRLKSRGHFVLGAHVQPN